MVLGVRPDTWFTADRFAELDRLNLEMNRFLRVFAFVLLALTLASSALAQKIIKPGDTVRVMCTEEPALNRDYTVTDDGLILVQFLGAVKIGGLTEKQASETISKQLIDDRILKKATVTVQIAQLDLKMIWMGGAISLEAETPWQEGMRLSRIVQIADPGPTTDLTNITIISENNSRQVVDFTKANLQTQEGNPLLKPGDRVLFSAKSAGGGNSGGTTGGSGGGSTTSGGTGTGTTTPPVGNTVKVEGPVSLPGTFEFSAGMTLSQILIKAGGFSLTADAERISLKRGETKRELRLPDDQNFALLPGDVVTVLARSNSSSSQTGGAATSIPSGLSITLLGALQQTGPIAYRNGMTLTDAIKEAGGFTDKARIDKVKILTPGNIKPREVNYRDIELKYTGDILLKPGQTIEVGGPQVQKIAGIPQSSTTKLAAGAVLIAFLLGR